MVSKISILKNSVFISVLVSASSLIGFIIQIILAQRFGASYEMDAYFAAISFPLLLVALLANPLNSVFIPLYKEASVQDNKNSYRFLSSVFWFYFFIIGIITCCFVVFSHSIATILLAGSAQKTIGLASGLLKPVGVYIFFYCMFFIMQSFYIAKNRYFLPYFSYLMGSISSICYILLFSEIQGIYAAVYGLLFGAILQFCFVLFPLIRYLSAIPDFWSSRMFSFFKIIIPFVIASAFFRSTPLIDRYFVSFLPQGEIAILGYSTKFIEGLLTFFATGLTIVLLPITSRLAVDQERDKLSEMLSWGIRAILLLATPVALYLLFFSHAFVGALFERGHFTAEITNGVGTVLVGYIGALIALSLGGQLTNILYAKKLHMKVIATNLLLLPFYIFLVKFCSQQWGVLGVSVAYSSLTIATTSIYIFLVKQYVSFETVHILKSAGKFLIGSFIMISIIYPIHLFLRSDNFTLFELMLELLIGSAIYFTSLQFLKAQEFMLFFKHLKNRALKNS